MVILFLAWVGIAIGMHALPTRGEMKRYLNDIPADLRHGPSYIILCAAVAPFAVVDAFKFLWVDFLYAVAVGLAAPFAATYLYMAFLEPQVPQSTSPPSVADDLVTCKKEGDEAIAACSRVITSANINPDDLAQAYVARGGAYYDTQD